MKLLKKIHFSNPIWQGLSGVVTLLGLIITIYVSYDIYQRTIQYPELTIEERYDFNLSTAYFVRYFDQPISISIGDKIFKSITSYSFRVENSGNQAIKPEDFVVPLRVKLDAPWQILSITTDFAIPLELEISWTKVSTNTFEMVPVLLNPGDNFSVDILMTNESLDSLTDAELIEKLNEEPPFPYWSARIVDIRYLRILRDLSPEEESGLGIFHTSLVIWGWRVYRIAATSVIFYYFLLVLISSSSIFGNLSIKQIVVLCVAMLFSLSAAVFPWLDADPFLTLFLYIPYLLIIIYHIWPKVISVEQQIRSYLSK